MTAPPVQVPWWIEHILSPGLFILLGASLGFALGRLKDSLDDRSTRKMFLKAVRVELSTMRTHLEGTLKDATETQGKLDKGAHEALQLATVFQTGVFSSQIGKLKRVFDPLVIDVIHFYDKVANLERIKSRLTTVAFELGSGAVGGERAGAVALQYRGTLVELIRRINLLLPEVSALIDRLPER